VAVYQQRYLVLFAAQSDELLLFEWLMIVIVTREKFIWGN
jgi:hypothetical protein